MHGRRTGASLGPASRGRLGTQLIQRNAGRTSMKSSSECAISGFAGAPRPGRAACLRIARRRARIRRRDRRLQRRRRTDREYGAGCLSGRNRRRAAHRPRLGPRDHARGDVRRGRGDRGRLRALCRRAGQPECGGFTASRGRCGRLHRARGAVSEPLAGVRGGLCAVPGGRRYRRRRQGHHARDRSRAKDAR